MAGGVGYLCLSISPARSQRWAAHCTGMRISLARSVRIGCSHLHFWGCWALVVGAWVTAAAAHLPRRLGGFSPEELLAIERDVAAARRAAGLPV